LQLEGVAAPAELLVLVGPEGGWSPAEQQTLAQSAAVPITLGSHVLRTETAAAAAVAAMHQVRRAWRRRSA
jgi:16S rRNA (uracil1498-N3)-methyltransferase